MLVQGSFVTPELHRGCHDLLITPCSLDGALLLALDRLSCHGGGAALPAGEVCATAELLAGALQAIIMCMKGTCIGLDTLQPPGPAPSCWTLLCWARAHKQTKADRQSNMCKMCRVADTWIY